MEYVSAKGTEVLYDTGRLFVQGPSKEDWEFVKDRGEEGEMEKRRIVEEGGEERVLGVDEWGYYEDAEEVSRRLAVSCSAEGDEKREEAAMER